MSTARIHRTSTGQVIEIPADLELPGETVEVHRQGDSLLITPAGAWPKPKATSWQPLLDGLEMFSDDFMAEGRQQPTSQQERDSLDP
jgi:antitoxin VapB